MNLIASILISIMAIGTYFAFHLASNRHAGAPELTNSLSIFLITLTLNITFPAALYYLFKDGTLVWARPFSGTSYVNEALLTGILSLLAFSLGYSATKFARIIGHESSKVPRKQPKELLAVRPDTPIAIQAMWLAIGLGVLMKLMAIYEFGIGPELIARLSGSVRREMILSGIEGKGISYLILLSTMAEAAAAALVARDIKNRNGRYTSVIVFILCIALTYILTGKRSSIILPVSLIICATSVYYKPLTLNHLPALIFFALAFGMGSLLLRILAPQSALGNVVDYRSLGGGSLLDFYLYSPEFAGFDMLVRAVAQGDRIRDALGGGAAALYRSTLEPFLYIIPRPLWSDKPAAFVDLSHGFYVVTFGGGITDQTPGFAATMIGYATVLGGPGLVAASFLLLGWFAAGIDRIDPRTYGGLVSRSLGLVLIFQLFRQGSIGWTFLTIVQTMTPAIFVWILFISLNNRTPVHIRGRNSPG